MSTLRCRLRGTVLPDDSTCTTLTYNISTYLDTYLKSTLPLVEEYCTLYTVQCTPSTHHLYWYRRRYMEQAGPMRGIFLDGNRQLAYSEYSICRGCPLPVISTDAYSLSTYMDRRQADTTTAYKYLKNHCM